MGVNNCLEEVLGHQLPEVFEGHSASSKALNGLNLRNDGMLKVLSSTNQVCWSQISKFIGPFAIEEFVTGYEHCLKTHDPQFTY